MKVNLKDYGVNKDKFVNIPDKEIENMVKILDIDEDEAIMTFLEDEGYLDNEEQEALEKMAKDNRITATIHQAKAEDKKKREYVRKEDPTKETLIAALADFLQAHDEAITNVKITNVGKIIEFELGGENYKLDLIRRRKK